MTRYGGSHIDFDAQGFTAGAVGGATLVASAFVACIANARASNWARWTRDTLIGGINYSEMMRARLFDELTAANRRLAEYRTEVTDLRAELRVLQARTRVR